jgi:hypothetical protein
VLRAARLPSNMIVPCLRYIKRSDTLRHAPRASRS